MITDKQFELLNTFFNSHEFEAYSELSKEELWDLSKLDLSGTLPTEENNAYRHYANVGLSNLEGEALKLTYVSTLIKKLVNVAELDFSNNDLTTLPDLSELVNLKRLNVSNNQIKEIEKDKLPPNLVELDISKNQLSTVKELSSMTTLKILNVDSNQITDLSPLNNLHQLYGITYFDNKIEIDLQVENHPNLQWGILFAG